MRATNQEIAERIEQAHNYLFDNLETSKIWPGPQEQHLSVDRLVDTSLILQQIYPNISINTEQIGNFEKAKIRLAGCELWINANDSMLLALSHSEHKRFDITRCDYLH